MRRTLTLTLTQALTLAVAQANPRYEASGLYAIPPGPVPCTGAQRVESLRPLVTPLAGLRPEHSAIVQGIVQLPEAFHLLMRRTLGELNLTCTPTLTLILALILTLNLTLTRTRTLPLSRTLTP